MTYRILLSGGGTAGSVTPLLALVEKIHQQRSDVAFRFIGSENGPERALVNAAGIPFTAISSGKLRRYWSWSNVSDLKNIWRGYRQAQSIVREWQPHVAVTAGSFVSVPVHYAAHRNGVPTIVHQQDVQPGLANRLMSRWANTVTVAFAVSESAFKGRHTRCIGNPVRPEVLLAQADVARKTYAIPKGMPVLLVLGGGTGSAVINETLCEIAPEITKQWFVVHVTGTHRASESLDIPMYRAEKFLTTMMPHVLAAADVVVSRAGLGAISECAALGKPTVFIPMPQSHQEANAEMLHEAQACIVVRQDDELDQRLSTVLSMLFSSPKERQQLGAALNKFYQPQAIDEFAEEVIRLLPA
jgi:UDP-N-acetylglucosamine--N-acetylmuramyl-(pentapeptide) pyrophosphoryl-undecaprenol N-acetylglucosamine transferase